LSKKHIGSSVDDFLQEEGIFEEAQAQAIKEVVAWQLAEAMRKKNISKARLATLLKTSRTQVDRILDPSSDITLSSLQRAALVAGQTIEIKFSEASRRFVSATGVRKKTRRRKNHSAAL
jgi:transcriptional regulator with XRE-family HTH domain